MTSDSLSTIVARQFDTGVQQRGTAYQRAGRVRIIEGDEHELVAMVRGTELYRVTIRRIQRSLAAECTCPYFEDAFCKHLWAVMLEADEQHLLQGDGINKGLRVEPLDTSESDDDFDEFDDDVEDGDFDENIDTAHGYLDSDAIPSVSPSANKPHRDMAWEALIESVTSKTQYAQWPANRELMYVVNLSESQTQLGILIDIATYDRKLDGSWSAPRFNSLSRSACQQLPDARDSQILALLTGAAEYGGYQYGISYHADVLPTRFRLSGSQPQLLLPLMCATNRCRLRNNPRDEPASWPTLNWDNEPWQFFLRIDREAPDDHYCMTGALRRGEEILALTTPQAILPNGILLTNHLASQLTSDPTSHTLSCYNSADAYAWMEMLLRRERVQVPLAQGKVLLQSLLRQAKIPPLQLPDELRFEEIVMQPRKRLMVKPLSRHEPEKLIGELIFDYDGSLIAAGDGRRGLFQADEMKHVIRDLADEQTAIEQLKLLGWRAPHERSGDPNYLELKAKLLPKAVRQLTREGWHVEAQGKTFRQSGQFKFAVSSGVDWFDIDAQVEFGDETVDLPKLLQAVRRGESSVVLGDGSLGLLPEEWLQKYGLLAGLGIADDQHLRFKRSQLGLLDILLSSQQQVSWDDTYAQARQALQSFSGVRAADPPTHFQGELRPYQREGLGWLHFLREFGFGGCLADDMGLGKTVQVLALLESRRELRAGDPHIGPSLVVMPKSLVFNWKQEAARFAPLLRVLDHTGGDRIKGNDHFCDYDLLITTYGTLRNDAEEFKDIQFDYVILDESQAIKNAASESAKAARLLRGDYRLALSGTPIENHLGELWSLFEFLNPGMLGASSVFKLANGSSRTVDPETRALLAQALRPFLLRRTKQQVLSDLPPKTEQTLYCDLDKKQRKLYDELRTHYRDLLTQRIASIGMARAKIYVLEALLRLRQAAIHPALIDKSHEKDSSAKLDLLLPRLQEVIDEGHKTIVFSQFTSMLSIVRRHLDKLDIKYEYLDGKTQNRQECVERFQNDPACKLFLISLKAGGTGLNLTAAQYVFLLDPWWNPAVEAQAIDRAHRIGQTNAVFAYRIIARDTIEEKVLQLQASKRELADAILDADNSIMGSLSKSDLELLLS